MVNYSRIIGEVMVLMKKSSVSESRLRQGTRTCPRWDLAETIACGGRKVFSWLPWFFWDFREYIGERPRAEVAPGAHKPGRRGAPWTRLGGLWGPWWPLALVLKFSDLLLFRKKSFWKFRSVWTLFKILLWKGSKTWKKQELALGTELISYFQKIYKRHGKHPKFDKIIAWNHQKL